MSEFIPSVPFRMKHRMTVHKNIKLELQFQTIYSVCDIFHIFKPIVVYLYIASFPNIVPIYPSYPSAHSYMCDSHACKAYHIHT